MKARGAKAATSGTPARKARMGPFWPLFGFTWAALISLLAIYAQNG